VKLRIRGDSLRLRLSPTELDTLAAGGMVADAVHFGPAPAQCLRCELSLVAGATELDAHFDDFTIRVLVPAEPLRRIAASDEVGLSSTKAVGAGRELVITLEKDFRCLVPRAGEDAEGFSRPDDAPSC
jgi:hypothetical protein